MALQKFQLRPGINKEATNYANEGGWYICDKVRFRSGQAEKIGGWVKSSANTYLGIARNLFNWNSLNSYNLMFVGTNVKTYIESFGSFNDITPIRETASLTGPFTVTAGSNTVNVLDAAHGAVTGDFVTFTATGTVTVGGLTIISGTSAEYQLTVVDINNYTITVAGTATGGSGGGAITAAYQISTGLAYGSGATGWGAGVWGGAQTVGVPASYTGWGDAVTASTLKFQPRLYGSDSYGQNLFFNIRDGGVYYWEFNINFPRAVTLSSVTGANDVPVIAKTVLMSEVDRHALAFGCQPTGSSSANDQDPLLIRWSTAENILDWQPTATNSAGGLRISTGNQIVAALRARQETLVWTESGLYSLQFIGAPEYFGVQQLGSNLSIMGPNAVTSANNVTYWMGLDKFYTYDGRVSTLKCDLWHYIFQDLSLSNNYQVFAGTNEGYNEVWWFYCSNTAGASDTPNNDKYVIYNYADRIWYYGTIQRSAWLDTPLRAYPVAANNLGQATGYVQGTQYGYLYNHEVGVDDDILPMTSSLESSNFDIAEGDHFSFIRRVIPDMSFDGSTTLAPSATMTLTARNFPGGSYLSSAPSAITRTATVPVEQYTQQTWIRIRGRQIAFTISSTNLGVQWQLGAPRLDVQVDGMRG
jgi:hypothetical protein